MIAGAHPRLSMPERGRSLFVPGPLEGASTCPLANTAVSLISLQPHAFLCLAEKTVPMVEQTGRRYSKVWRTVQGLAEESCRF